MSPFFYKFSLYQSRLLGLLSASVAVALLAIVSTHALANTTIKIDGSSTVFPIAEAFAEEFQSKNKGVRVTVGTSGTGGGFKKFAAGEIDIANASRPIKEAEAAAAKAKGIDFIELPIAIDGLAVAVHPSNSFVTSLTLAQLKSIWQPESTIKLWSDVNPSWPKEKIALFGPGPDSGTFDYFTEVVIGKARAMRADYTASEDDNVLIKGIAGSKFSLGFFGHGYLTANAKRLKGLSIDGGSGPISPDDANVATRKYPLSRSLYIYVTSKSYDRAEIKNFVQFMATSGKHLVHDTGYLPLSEPEYQEMQQRFAKKVLGSKYIK
jgi:phosphate transport system substrate-binding protein